MARARRSCKDCHGTGEVWWFESNDPDADKVSGECVSCVGAHENEMDQDVSPRYQWESEAP